MADRLWEWIAAHPVPSAVAVAVALLALLCCWLAWCLWPGALCCAACCLVDGARRFLRCLFCCCCRRLSAGQARSGGVDESVRRVLHTPAPTDDESENPSPRLVRALRSASNSPRRAAAAASSSSSGSPRQSPRLAGYPAFLLSPSGGSPRSASEL